MDELTAYLPWIALGVALFFFDVWLEKKLPCDCGRSRGWYFFAQHERAGLMLARAIWTTVWTIIFLLGLSWVVGPLLALASTWHWRRWWFHEKDKLKKKAAKAAGVVGFNEHGKLVVKQVEA